MLDDEAAASSVANHRRIMSTLVPFFSLLSSSVDAAHRRIVLNVTTDFIRLLSRLVTAADVDFAVEVFISLLV